MPPLAAGGRGYQHPGPIARATARRTHSHPRSGEINYRVNDARAVIQAVRDHYAEQKPKLDTTDGISLESAEWRMSLRSSDTEPPLRLNIEAKVDSALVAEQVRAIEQIITQ